jgi:hypothetical protein
MRISSLVVGASLAGFFPAAAMAATVTGDASIYANVLAGSTVTRQLDGNNVSVGGLGFLTDRTGGRNTNNGADRLVGNNNSTATWIIDTPAPVNIGTIITLTGVPSGFLDDMPFTIQFDGIVRASDPGTRPSHPYIVTPVGRQASQLRIDMGMAKWSGDPVGSPNTYADFQELIVLSEKRGTIDPVVESVSGTNFGNQEGLADLQGSIGGSTGGWYDGTANQPKFAILDLGGRQPVAGMVLATWENVPASFAIQIGNGVDPWTTIASVTLSAGELVAVRFDDPQFTTKIRLNFGTAAEAALQEALVLVYLPEPSAALFLLPALLTLRRSRH